MVDVEVRARALKPPKYPHSTVLTTTPSAHYVTTLLGEDLGRFIVAKGAGATVLVAGGALVTERIRSRFAGWAATFGWDRVGEAVRTLKEEARTSFAVAVIADDRLVIFGDAFGSMPIYHDIAGRIVATNPDSVGEAVGAAYDPVSFADMAVTKRICHPFTLYDGVRQLSPTAYIELAEGSFSVRESGYRPPVLAGRQLIDSAAASLQRSVGDHLDGRPAVLAISGGLDSRVLASLTKPVADTQSFSITEKPSRDASIGALAAAHRGLRHQMIVLRSTDFARHATEVVAFATSQNLAQHAHFAPIGKQMRSAGEILVTGYGANANFERYDSVKKLEHLIAASDVTQDIKAELKRRWAAHAEYVGTVLDVEPGRLAAAWPSTQKKAFAFVTTNRHLMPSFDPFIILPEMFSAKALVRREASDLATALFRRFCGDETHLPTTRPRHPLGVAIGADPSAEQKDAGWPRKGTMFRFAAGRKNEPALGALHPADGAFFRQVCAVDAVWRSGSASADTGSLARRLLARIWR